MSRAGGNRNAAWRQPQIFFQLLPPGDAPSPIAVAVAWNGKEEGTTRPVSRALSHHSRGRRHQSSIVYVLVAPKLDSQPHKRGDPDVQPNPTRATIINCRSHTPLPCLPHNNSCGGSGTAATEVPEADAEPVGFGDPIDLDPGDTFIPSNNIHNATNTRDGQATVLIAGPIEIGAPLTACADPATPAA